jgi:hypothetical protein
MEQNKKLQWNVWLKQAETEAFFRELEEMRSGLAEAWIGGDFIRPSVEETALVNARALGQAQMLESILDIRTEKRMEAHE